MKGMLMGLLGAAAPSSRLRQRQHTESSTHSMPPRILSLTRYLIHMLCLMRYTTQYASHCGGGMSQNRVRG